MEISLRALFEFARFLCKTVVAAGSLVLVFSVKHYRTFEDADFETVKKMIYGQRRLNRVKKDENQVPVY